MKRAGTVAAAAGAVAVAPFPLSGASASTHPNESALTAAEELAADEHLVAHVRNARTGEIVLFIGHRQVTLYDRKVAARLVRAAR